MSTLMGCCQYHLRDAVVRDSDQSIETLPDPKLLQLFYEQPGIFECRERCCIITSIVMIAIIFTDYYHHHPISHYYYYHHLMPHHHIIIVAIMMIICRIYYMNHLRRLSGWIAGACRAHPYQRPQDQQQGGLAIMMTVVMPMNIMIVLSMIIIAYWIY